MSNYVKRRSRKRPDPEPVAEREELPVMYSAQMENEGLPSMHWMEWSGPELRLVLSPRSTVNLREGDKVLGWVGQNGRLEVYGYQPRTLH